MNTKVHLIWASVILVILGLGAWLFYSLQRSAVEITTGSVERLARLLDAEVTDRFETYLESTQQVQQLVLCQVERNEILTRTIDGAFGEARLEIRAPVEYNYFVDMQGEWQLVIENGTLLVTAPALEVKTPAIGKMERHIQYSATIFGEEDAMQGFEERYHSTVVELAASPQYIDQVRSEARESLSEYVHSWVRQFLLEEYEVGSVVVKFRDEETFPRLRYHIEPELRIE